MPCLCVIHPTTFHPGDHATAVVYAAEPSKDLLVAEQLLSRPLRPRPPTEAASMAQPQSQPRPEEPPLPPRIPVIHNAALAGAIITPLAMLLPPRRLDIRFLVLFGGFALSTNQLSYEYTGTSIYSRFGQRIQSASSLELPEGARRTQQLLKEHREKEAAEKRTAGDAQGKEKEGGLAALGKDIWMGSETEGWEKRRSEEHKRKLEEGQGIGEIIMEQIADVFSGNWRAGANKSEGEDGSSSNESERPENKQ